jgi:uncharacterized heparinase superfamily protein
VSRPGLPTVLRTLWYMRRAQVAGELRERVLGRRRIRRRADETPHLRVTKLPVPRLAAPKGTRHGRARGWEDAGLGRMELEAIHAFGWLGAESLRPPERLRAMLDWIAHHPDGIGWEPLPTSRRALAWLAALTTPGLLPPLVETHGRVLPSLGDQLATLERSLAPHRADGERLLGRLALASAALLLEGGEAVRWLAELPLLVRELDAQLGADGAHAARSPMLHAELLAALLDVLNASRAAPGVAPDGFEDHVAHAAGAMLGAHAVWTHPDGEIALLGDSTLGVAPRLAALRAYAAALGVAPAAPEPRGVLRDAGVVRLEAGPFAVIVSVSAPAPPWHPVHAHCDALAFELSVHGERIVSDAGAGQRFGPERALARATRSHATALVNGAEQAELWGERRIGGRPDVGLVRVVPDALLEGVCAGWATPDVLHRRLFALEGNALRIEDRFDQPAKTARLALPLAPDVSVRLDGARAELTPRRGRRIGVQLPGAVRWRVERGPCFFENGEAQERAVLVGDASELAAADWRIEVT